MGLHRFHQRDKQVLALPGGLLQGLLPLDRAAIPRALVAAHVGDLLAFFFLGAADQLDGGGDFAAVAFVEVGVHAYPRQATVVRPAAGLDVVLQHLAALIRTVALAHSARPEAAGTRPITVYSGSLSLLKKNERLGARSSIFMASEIQRPFSAILAGRLCSGKQRLKAACRPGAATARWSACRANTPWSKGQMGSRRRVHRRQLGDSVQRILFGMGGAVPSWRLEMVTDHALRRDRQPLLAGRRTGDVSACCRQSETSVD
mgnify:CR=1 FL=1